MLAISDAHLDIAWSSLKHGRDFVAGHPDSGLGLPELLAGGVTLACATVYTAKFDREHETAKEVAEQQLAYYDALPGRSKNKVVWPADVVDVGMSKPGERVCLVGLMEGCEPIGPPEELEEFHRRGIRVVGLTWNKRNKWAAGCDDPGGLSADGASLAKEIDRLNMVHDISHLSRTAVDDLLATARGPIMASHVACDAVFEHPRNLTDAHLTEVAKRGGVVGLVLYTGFLAESRATMDDILRHLMHMLEVCGPDAVGIGSDIDGGFSRDKLPTGIRTSADLPRILEALGDRGVSDQDLVKIAGSNFRRVLTAVM